MGNQVVREELVRYVEAGFVAESPAHKKLREETARMTHARMQLGMASASLLGWFVKLLGCRRALEIGTFTGYSALTVAEAMPADGTLVCCDVSEEWTSIARRHWDAAGIGKKIELRLGPAVKTLDELIGKGRDSFDMAFIDADKPNYDAYYERCLELVRPGGILLFDNVLWGGDVVKPGTMDADTAALHAINQKVKKDERVDRVLLTVGDGLLIARKRHGMNAK